jgi:hypothetical protein
MVTPSHQVHLLSVADLCVENLVDNVFTQNFVGVRGLFTS